MKSNQRVLAAGFLASLVEADRINNLSSVERDTILATSHHLVGDQPEAERVMPSQAAMEEAGFKPLVEGTLRSRADDTREASTNTYLPGFRRSGNNNSNRPRS